MALLRDFRLSVYSERQQYLFNGGDEDRTFDQRSWNFGIFNRRGELVGASRCTPCVDGKWESTGTMPDHLHAVVDPTSYVQFNRVAIRKDYRLLGAHEYMFREICLWCFRNLSFTHFFSICKKALLRIYSRFNIEVLEGPFIAPNRASNSYYVIRGNIASTVALLQDDAFARGARHD